VKRVVALILPLVLAAAIPALAVDGASVGVPGQANAAIAPTAAEPPAMQPQACGCKGMAGCCSEDESRAAAPTVAPSGCGCAGKSAVAPKAE
jgi:hypothetical protein